MAVNRDCEAGTPIALMTSVVEPDNINSTIPAASQILVYQSYGLFDDG